MKRKLGKAELTSVELNMESDTVEKIRAKFRTLEPEDQKKVLEFVERLSAENAQGNASANESLEDGSKGP